MWHSTLGKTGSKVSALACGCNALRLYDESVAQVVFNYALDNGITLIETGRMYDSGKTEEWIGKAVSSRREEYVLASKCSGHLSYEEAKRAIDLSLQALGTDHIDHYICNCCHDCCIGLQIIRSREGAKFVAPSRFQAYIDEEACIGCEECLERCYFDALSMNEEGDEPIAAVNTDKCVGCGLCAVVCPSEAIHFNEAHPVDFIPTSKT